MSGRENLPKLSPDWSEEYPSEYEPPPLTQGAFETNQALEIGELKITQDTVEELLAREGPDAVLHLLVKHGWQFSQDGLQATHHKDAHVIPLPYPFCLEVKGIFLTRKESKRKQGRKIDTNKPSFLIDINPGIAVYSFSMLTLSKKYFYFFAYLA